MGKRKKEKESQYFTTFMNITVVNYRVYYMNAVKKGLNFILAFIVGAAVAYLFYGGLAKDAYGEATTLTYILDIGICGFVGILAGIGFIPIREKQILKSRQRKLKKQFIDFLDSLATSIAAGKNVQNSFISSKEDLALQYEDKDFIMQEVGLIVTGITHNISIDSILEDFGVRSGIKDIENFSKVFKVAYSKGGDMQDVIRNCHGILSSKLLIEQEIETKVSGNKSEQYLMAIMPILIICMIKFSGSDFATSFATVSGVISSTISIILFVISFIIGGIILDIEV